MNARANDRLHPIEPQLLPEPAAPLIDVYEQASGTDVLAPDFRGPRLNVMSNLRAGERVYELRGSFIVRLTVDDGVVSASHRDLPVFGYGSTAGEAFGMFAEYFDEQYRDLVEADEASLTEDALIVRRQLQRVVAAVHEHV